jgi:hypothetical protein
MRRPSFSRYGGVLLPSRKSDDGADGKDGHPFPVDRDTYDKTIEVLWKAVSRANVDRSERVAALKRLAAFDQESTTAVSGGRGRGRGRPVDPSGLACS